MRTYEYSNVVVHRRKGVPHWQVPQGLYFVTWRLFDAVPREDEFALRNLRNALELARERDPTGCAAIEIEREIFRLLERSLDRNHGAAFMRDPSIADLVYDAFEYGNGGDYELVTQSVMPNHVHVVFRLNGQLDEVIQRWKSYTAHAANKILGRHGSFWAEGYFDVLIRNSLHLERTVSYVRNNPLKAGLHDWRWVGFSPEMFAQLI